MVVLVHGYQGNSWDMRMFKNQLQMAMPKDNTEFLLSAVNEGKTEGDIAEMGTRLAREVDTFITENCFAGRTLGRLSFVCHSLGGVIVRAAIAQAHYDDKEPKEYGKKLGRLRPYLDKLYTLVTLASPHCGYMYSENPLLTTGIWVLRKWSKSVCLTQLSLADNPSNPKEAYIYKLSQERGLEYFENVFLLGSNLDKYAPFHSARIELHKEAMLDTKKGDLYRTMVHNILKPLQKTTIKRVDVDFVVKKKVVDNLIGRTAHICFLDHQQYMVMFVWLYRGYFA